MKKFYGVLWLILLFSVVCFAQIEKTSKTTTRKISLFVTDKNGNLITNIQKDDLRVKIRGKEITNFTVEYESAPVLYILAIDNSGSMRFLLDQIVSSAKNIVNQNNANDGTVLMRFVDKKNIRITSKFTSDKTFLHKTLDNFYIEGGQTAVIDAIYKSVQILADQKGVTGDYRRFVIVISDGEDRSSVNTKKQLFELLEKSNVQVLFLGLINELDGKSSFNRKSSKKEAKNFINSIAKLSGGVAIFPKENKDILKLSDNLVPLMRKRQFIKLKTSQEFKNSDIEVKSSKKSKKKLVFFTNLIK